MNPDDTQNGVRTKLLAVITSADPRIDDILENLLAEFAVKKNDKFKLIEKCNRSIANLGIKQVLVDSDTVKKHPKLLVKWCVVHC